MVFHKILHKPRAGAGFSRSEKIALNSMLIKFLFHFNLVARALVNGGNGDTNTMCSINQALRSKQYHILH
jgi:hypothetical protein